MTEREQRISDSSDVIEQNEMLIARELLKDNPNLEYIGTLIEFNVNYARKIRELNSASEQMFKQHKDIYMNVDPPQDRGKLVMRELIKGLHDPKLCVEQFEQRMNEDIPNNLKAENIIYLNNEPLIISTTQNIGYLALLVDIMRSYYKCKFYISTSSYDDVLSMKIKIENRELNEEIPVSFINDTDIDDYTLNSFKVWMFNNYGEQTFPELYGPTDTTQPHIVKDGDSTNA